MKVSAHACWGCVIQQHPHNKNSTLRSWSIHRCPCLRVKSRGSLHLIKCKRKTLAQVCLATSKSSVIAWNPNFLPQHPVSPLHTTPSGSLELDIQALCIHPLIGRRWELSSSSHSETQGRHQSLAHWEDIPLFACRNKSVPPTFLELMEYLHIYLA